MPRANIGKIYAVSSEDPQHPASRLLLKEHKKWVCLTPGEKQVYVILQLERPTQIQGIDIGNHHSAYITVSVAKMGAQEKDFEQILLTSSFMTPMGSKNSETINHVRLFGKDCLIPTVCNEKWDLVKVMCTQPYNRYVQYGLAFIVIHTSDVDATQKPLGPSHLAALNTSVSPFAKFKLREDSPDSESEASGALFLRWKQSKADPVKGVPATSSPISAAAAIRDSSSAASLKNRKGFSNKEKFSPQPSTSRDSRRSPPRRNNNIASDDDNSDEFKANRKDRNRDALLYDEDDDKPNEKLQKKLNHDKLEREKNNLKLNQSKSRTEERSSDKFKDFLGNDESKKVDKIPMKDDRIQQDKHHRDKVDSPKIRQSKEPKTALFSPVASVSHKHSLSPIANHISVKKNKPEPIYKSFHELLEGVVLVISGIQNPFRAQIRDKALEMGAKYKADWDDTCTHLICAFKNTPKYNQVCGHGKIIKKDWITSCYDKKRRIPWRRHALDSNERDLPDSEDEILDLRQKPKAPIKQSFPSTSTACTSQELPKIPKIRHESSSDDDKSTEIAESDEDERYNSKSDYIREPKNEILSSGSDTEDEIEKVKLRKKGASPHNSETNNKACTSGDIYNKTTDEEQRSSDTQPDDGKSITRLPYLFKDKKFYLSTSLGAVPLIKLNRFIVVYGGEVISNAIEADFIISDKPKKLPANFKGELVKPLWVFECNDMEYLLPTKRYKFDEDPNCS